MSTDADTVLRNALGLSPDDRADVAAQLLASLEDTDDPDTVRSQWTAELQRRAKLVLSGETPTEDWTSVRQRLADQLSE